MYSITAKKNHGGRAANKIQRETKSSKSTIEIKSQISGIDNKKLDKNQPIKSWFFEKFVLWLMNLTDLQPSLTMLTKNLKNKTQTTKFVCEKGYILTYFR